MILGLEGLDQVLALDEVNRAARVQTGVFDTDLEDQLGPAGLTLRHFPQSLGFSTVADGWPPAGGHFATSDSHIDDLTESMRVVVPKGVFGPRSILDPGVLID